MAKKIQFPRHQKDHYWYRWAPDAYLTDTLHLTLVEDAIYRRLIDQYMLLNGRLPDSDMAIARLVGVGLDQWSEAAPVIREFFTEKDGFLRQKKADETLFSQKRFLSTASKAGKAGAKSRWHKTKLDNNGPYGDPNGVVITSPMQYRYRDRDRDREEKTRKKQQHPAAGCLGFEGKVIRLKTDDYQRWKKAFAALDIDSELTALDAYYDQQDVKNWFVRCASALANKQKQAGNGTSPEEEDIGRDFI